MLKPLNLCAYYTNNAEKQFFSWLSDAFNHLFCLQLSNNRVLEVPCYLSFQDSEHLHIHNDTDHLMIAVPDNYAQDSSFVISLNKVLSDLYHKQTMFYDYVPLRTTYYDSDGHLIYDNQGFDGNFFTSNLESKPLEPWILEKITDDSTHQLTVSIPSSSFDQVLLQHYQGFLTKKGHLLGILCQVIDLKPLLGTYLEESGQALVGWSDTTSGASIANNFFDEEF